MFNGIGLSIIQKKKKNKEKRKWLLLITSYQILLIVIWFHNYIKSGCNPLKTQHSLPTNSAISLNAIYS